MTETRHGNYASLSLVELSRGKRIIYLLLEGTLRDETHASVIYQFLSTLRSIEDAQRALIAISCVLRERIQSQCGIHKYFNYELVDHRVFIHKLIRNQLKRDNEDPSVDPMRAIQCIVTKSYRLDRCPIQSTSVGTAKGICALKNRCVRVHQGTHFQELVVSRRKLHRSAGLHHYIQQ